MNKTTFKEKSMKKGSLVTKESSNRQHQTQGRPNHTHNPPSKFPQHQTHQKGGCARLFKEQLYIYATFGQKLACIRGFWPKTCVYTRILAKNLRVYATFGQKSMYVCDFWPKTCVYREDSGQTKGQTNKGECQWMKIL